MVDSLSYPVTGDHHLSDDWDDHVNRGSLGGVDFPVAYGTPVYADHDGYLAIDNSPAGSGGRVATVQGGGITTQCLHLSRFARGNGNVVRGELIAYSGASAYGSDYGTGGPHVHWHAIVNGIRVNPLNYLAAGNNTPAGGGTTPIGDWLDMASIDDVRQVVAEEVAKNNTALLTAIGTSNDNNALGVKNFVRDLIWLGDEQGHPSLIHQLGTAFDNGTNKILEELDK